MIPAPPFLSLLDKETTYELMDKNLFMAFSEGMCGGLRAREKVHSTKNTTELETRKQAKYITQPKQKKGSGLYFLTKHKRIFSRRCFL